MRIKRLLPFILSILFFQNAYTQTPANLSLKEILNIGETNYPLLKQKAFEITAAKKGIDVSKSSGIPSLDASYQLNYTTYNNITGMVYPQFIIPISGPPSNTNNLNGVFGSATSLLLNWLPVTFGQREAQVAYAQAGVSYATSDATNEIFQHKIKLANAYLDVLTINELIKVFNENIVRAEANLSNVKELVKNRIKPGVDTALFSSEVSKAKIDLLIAKKLSKNGST